MFLFIQAYVALQKLLLTEPLKLTADINTICWDVKEMNRLPVTGKRQICNLIYGYFKAFHQKWPAELLLLSLYDRNINTIHSYIHSEDSSEIQ